MQNHLKKIYSQARRDVGREWYKYMESIKPEADKLLKAYEDAKLTDDKDLIKKTGKEYGQFLREKTYMNKRYKSMLDTTTTKLANVNEIALSYLNDEMPKVYVTNYNQLSKDMPAGISFSLVDETTVKNLVKDNPKLLPTKKLDIPKDKRWNQKAINAQVLQGIIQGESIPEMAKRLMPIMDRNKKSAIRNARTMTTSAQNKGRLDSYKTAQDNGVVLHKIWMATNSERTRAWHAALNGVEVEIDKPFENDYGKIMFPGDPEAHPGNLYNCRCTLTTKIIGFKREDGSIRYIDGEEPTTADEVVEEEEPVEIKSEVKVSDLSEELQKTLYNYTDGDYVTLCDYSQYIMNGDADISPSQFASTKQWWEENRLPGITEQEKKDAVELLNIINDQPVSDTPLVRIEKSALDVSSGDEVTFGLRSTSSDLSFINKIENQDMRGFDMDLLGEKNNGNWTEYHFINSKGLDVSAISAYPEQQETIIAGTYKVVSVEKIDPVKQGLIEKDIKVSDMAENITPFTSKSGKDMIRYNYNGKEMTDTVEKFYSRTDTIYETQKGVWGRTIVTLEVK